jgi:hypothetical protein
VPPISYIQTNEEENEEKEKDGFGTNEISVWNEINGSWEQRKDW